MIAMDDVLGLPDIIGLPDQDALMVIGLLIDFAADANDPSANDRALEFAKALDERGLSPANAALLNYFRANAWSNRRPAFDGKNASASSWTQPEMEQQILHLRRALTSTGFDDLEPRRRCEILTNLANLLNSLGRFVEARATWTRALTIDPGFWMARGNRGSGLIDYARSLYDTGHRDVFGLAAHRELTQAEADLKRNPSLGDPAVGGRFLALRTMVEGAIDLAEVERSFRPDGHSLGETQAERSYRKWCLREVLFLNPLNDVEPFSVAANDILTLPDFAAELAEPPVLIGFFNQLKQEYVSARWRVYEASTADEPHFSDRGVLLFNTLDYPSYGLSVETIKLAFRAAYSIFDKIAFFLNHYMGVGLAKNSVNFRRIWRESEKSPLRAIFEANENWPLRGLYWLSRDLFDEEIHESIEPEARELNSIRNHLEHKYLKLHDLPFSSESNDELFLDTLSQSILLSDFEKKTLQLLKLARAALIYLSLGMHQEERRRERLRGPGLVASMTLPEWSDDWKR